MEPVKAVLCIYYDGMGIKHDLGREGKVVLELYKQSKNVRQTLELLIAITAVCGSISRIIFYWNKATSGRISRYQIASRSLNIRSPIS